MTQYDDVPTVQLGVGILGGMQLDSLYNDIPNANVTAVYDPKFFDEELREEITEEYPDLTAYPNENHDYKSFEAAAADEKAIINMLLDEEDPDAANVVTPHTLHYQQVSQLLENEVNVHVEKPMATTTAHATDLYNQAEENGLLLQPGYQRSFHPFYGEVRNHMDVIGEPTIITGYVSQDWWNAQKHAWRANGDLSGQTGEIAWGMGGDTGSHVLQALLETVDMEPSTVSAMFDTRIGTGEAPVDVNGTWRIGLEREDGGTTYANISTVGDGQPGGLDEEMIFFSPNGQLTYQRNGDAAQVTLDVDGTTEVLMQKDEGADVYRELNQEKLQRFIDSVQRDAEQPDVAPSYAVDTTALHEAGYLSAQQGGVTVDVQELVAAADSERVVPADD